MGNPRRIPGPNAPPLPGASAKRYSTIVVAPSDSTHTDGADFLLTGTADEGILQDACDAASAVSSGELLILDGTVHLTDGFGSPGVLLRGMGGNGPGTTIAFPKAVGDNKELLLNFGAVRDLYIDGSGGAGTPSTGLTVISGVQGDVSGVVCNTANGSDGDGNRFITTSSGSPRIFANELSCGDGWTCISLNINAVGASVFGNWIGFHELGIKCRADNARIFGNTIEHGLTGLLIDTTAALANVYGNTILDESDANGAVNIAGGSARFWQNIVRGAPPVQIEVSANGVLVINNDLNGGGVNDLNGGSIFNLDGSANNWNL